MDPAKSMPMAPMPPRRLPPSPMDYFHFLIGYKKTPREAQVSTAPQLAPPPLPRQPQRSTRSGWGQG